MADKSSLLKAFNTHFFDFVDDIITIFPESEDIRSTKTAFELFRKANPTSILKAWHIFVYIPYHKVIEEGKIEFFFEKDYKDDLVYMSNANDIVKIIDTLRDPIRQMSDTNKSHSMKYIQNLAKLSQMYMMISQS
jgi:hypothetical protein